MGILSNNEGKILRSNQTGEVIKQNYNFNNSILPQSQFFLDVPGIVGMDLTNSSIGILYTQTRADEYSGDFTIFQDGVKDNSITGSRRGPGNFLYSYNGVSSTNVRVGIDDDIFTGCSIDVNGEVTSASHNVIGTVDRPSSLIVSNFYILRGSGAYHSDRITSSGKMNSFLFYKRILSEEEYAYWKNNYLGNEPLLRTDLVFFLKMSAKAEIFDFGGVVGQAVGIRDYSGNNYHGRIRNLPAGTLQEQLDYANANLFEKW